MAVAASSGPRVSVDGKFFRLGDKKFYVKGVAYGPFEPNAAGQPFASPEQTAADFALRAPEICTRQCARGGAAPPHWADQAHPAWVTTPRSVVRSFVGTFLNPP